MDRKTLNRVTSFFLTAAVIVVVLMLAGTLRRTSRITLPSAGAADGQGSDGASGNALQVIQVTPETVQAAIATLSRPEDYRRTVTVEQFWSGGSGIYEVMVAVGGGWTRTDRTLPGGRTRHALTDGARTYIWYDAEEEAYAVPAGGISADDEQTIPTYEDILALPVESIAAADYRTISGLNCIYVETLPEDGYVQRYWVSVDTGLLVASERLLEEETVYRMAAPSVEQAVQDAENFTLPDGTVLIEA